MVVNVRVRIERACVKKSIRNELFANATFVLCSQ